jgi:hypothetical protein
MYPLYPRNKRKCLDGDPAFRVYYLRKLVMVVVSPSFSVEF